MDLIKIACVNYLNTLPFIKGLRKLEKDPNFKILYKHPADCLKLIKDGHVDIALIPSAGFLQLDDHRIITDFSISSDGAVKTVAVFSYTPIKDVQKIYLDLESTTSVALLKLLLKYYCKKDIQFISCDVRQVVLKSGDAVLMIGDKSFDAYKTYRYAYDLADYWKKWTGGPFVFAIWVAQNDVPDSVSHQLNELFTHHVSELKDIIDEFQSQHPEIDLKEYYDDFVEFDLSEKKRKMLKQFLIELS